MKNATKVVCSCKHEYQDKAHGTNVRVATVTQKGTPTSRDVRCTVCSKVHSVPVGKL
jgi:hypothetical protein